MDVLYERRINLKKNEIQKKENPVIKGELLPYEWLAKEEANGAPKPQRLLLLLLLGCQNWMLSTYF